MKNEDVKIGMKVVPFRKTAPGWAGLGGSYHWVGAGGRQKGFLYVIGWDVEESCWLLSHDLDDVGSEVHGDFFRASDFKPYEPPV